MRVPKWPFIFQFKNEKRKANYMCPNSHLFFKLKMRNEKRNFLSFRFIFKLKQQLQTYILQNIISFRYYQTYKYDLTIYYIRKCHQIE